MGKIIQVLVLVGLVLVAGHLFGELTGLDDPRKFFRWVARYKYYLLGSIIFSLWFFGNPLLSYRDRVGQESGWLNKRAPSTQRVWGWALFAGLLAGIPIMLLFGSVGLVRDLNRTMRSDTGSYLGVFTVMSLIFLAFVFRRLLNKRR
jgi:hypothetical protein